MNSFEVLQQVIRNRRSTKPALMNGKKIDDHLVWQLLELADWAPTHARTEPWRFIVLNGEALKEFCLAHAELYKANIPPDKFTNAKYMKLQHDYETISHMIVVYMKRTERAKIPALEEIAAVATAVQNILLGASALGIAALWSTGGMTHHPAMKELFRLKEEDVLMGLVNLGYSDEEVAREGRRDVSMNEKIIWKTI